MFVNLWRTAPFLRLLLPFAAGITAGMYFPVIPWPCMALCALLWLLPSFFNLQYRFAWRRVRGVAVLGMMCCFGMALAVAADIRRDAGWLGHWVEEDMYCVAVLKEPPVKKRKSWKAEVEVVMVRENETGMLEDGTLQAEVAGSRREKDGMGTLEGGRKNAADDMKENGTLQAEARVLPVGKWKPAKGAMLVYFREQPPLDYGSKILICATPQRITGSGNPGAFDYARYCAKKNIFHQIFPDSSAWRQLPGNGGSRLGRWLNISRRYALSMLRKYIPSKEKYGVAQALLIGYRNELDADIVQAYTNTGVVHIIAISGLHLGLIYVSLLQLLKWLPRRRWAEMLKALLLIAVLWAFSLLTGASASVLRSAVMFTTIAIGQFVIGRHSNIYNTLAAAAFLLLCYDPFFLVDAGFQLSFLAVAGIVLCYRPLYDLWMIRNKWLDKLWQMAAVSLAAQAFTWPVCLLYFHQFPNYFLLANIVAVPLSTLLLYGEIVLMMIAEAPLVAGWVGKALEWGIFAMNTMIQWIDGIPGAVINGIAMNVTQMFLLYAITIAVVTAWLLKRKPSLWWALALTAVFVSYGAVRRICWQRQRLLVIYNLPKLTVVEYVEGRESWRTGDSAGLEHPVLAASQLALGVKESGVFPSVVYLPPPRQTAKSSLPASSAGPLQETPDSSSIPAHQNSTPLSISYARKGYLLSIAGKRLLILNTNLRHAHPPLKKIKIDYILLSHNPKVDISRLQDFFIYEQLIFDASNSAFQRRKWKNACNELPLRCFSVPEQGAFVVNL